VSANAPVVDIALRPAEVARRRAEILARGLPYVVAELGEGDATLPVERG
jgi:hypothetical protein